MADRRTSIEQFLEEAAARRPVPGGGAIAALAGALSASMGEMVVQYSLRKKDLAAFQSELEPALAELSRARLVMLQLMEEDQTAYEALSALRKLPAQDPARQDEQAALITCIQIPQVTGATATAVLDLCDRIAGFCNHYLLSDLAVCSDLAMATVRCAVYNIRVNAADVESARQRQQIETEMSHMLSHAAGLIQSLSPRIWSRWEQTRGQ